MSIQSGNVYKIYNGKSGTILDLSGTDGRTVSGFSDNNGDNQKWQLEQGPGGHWTFRSVASGQYLGVDGPIENGTPLVSVNEPFRWDIYPDDEDSSVFRVYVPGASTATNIDLSDHGNATPGTIVTLWIKWEGKNQTWRFEQA
ncbi:carbohydrate-binding module family 13 protein [Lentinula detonsa]|uniref:Carbohydrate-binding module family 13 protein n=1 Tax=Lentinula detonsa TaxID=2804962 RepID=A0A9W8PCK9_9AGAR|nr:carbohydrate-binding module family 13 protein [Lentinula detonsa]KAJ3980022.1 carbohydrate-binding module family 13 protein [Lentinula detonsa]